MKRYMAVIVLGLMVAGCGDKPAIPKLDEIESAQIVFNAPKDNPAPFRIEDPKDKATIDKIINWLNSSQTVRGDTSPPQPTIGPTELVIKLRNGNSVTIEPARDCTTTKLADGGTKIDCKKAEGQVILDDGKKRGRLKAPELDAWIPNGWKAGRAQQ